MKISDNKFVTLTYDLNVGEGEERELMEQATAERPLEFILVPTLCLKHLKNRSTVLKKVIHFLFI